MKYNKIQLMLYGKGLNFKKANFNTDKIKINNIHQLKNDSYAFLDIEILNSCLPGEYILSIYNNNDDKEEIVFPVYERNKDNNRYLGFDSEDIIYLITPDRFANGDISNDNIEGMRDFTDRSDILRRHGGDIQGIIDKLDYIKELGFTALWINPLIENDMDISYHGYAATDLYKIDPRFGSNDLYSQLVEKAHNLGLKIIMDHVSNHVGMYHPWVNNPPTENWFHGTMENHLNARHD
ncbi:MAG: cyclomaltodextrinase N-terminal domain-containing protein, partial [Calditrichia bacterium]|nr:cyclomaltodextrinase N-terminal domain-containing protein [Calditrichia bacterium]